jgi:hypothetical protein
VSIPPVTAVTRCLQLGCAASSGTASARARSRLTGSCRRLALASTAPRLACVLSCTAGLAAAMAAPPPGARRLAMAGYRGILGWPGPGAVGSRLIALACADARP